MSLSVNHLNYKVGSKQLLSDVSITVKEPKVIGIIGPNGAGKSTLIKCLSGLLLTEDTIEINHQKIESYSSAELAKVRAALPQESHLTFPFPAKDVVGMSFALSTISKQHQNEIIHQCLEKVAAEELSDRNFLSLSGGEKQRIHLARIIAQLMQHQISENMRFLMLDEPTAPLDMKHQFHLFKELAHFKSKNLCSIVVIHDINLAASYCDELWVIDAGKLVSQATPHEVISQDLMKQVFKVDVVVSHHGQSAVPFINNPGN
ncbi:MAG: heme ABC transporter ATP-binding protein [Marinicella sp.]